MLEKAWSKVTRSYASLLTQHLGQPDLAIEHFTGAPSQVFSKQSHPDLWADTPRMA